MSAMLSSRGELGGINAMHLQCPLCGHFSKSHAHQLSHTASIHPKHLDEVAVGRLGNIIIYQSTAKLFHCYQCFFTTKEFPKLYEHIITLHCMDRDKEMGGEEGEREETGGEEGGREETGGEEGGREEREGDGGSKEGEGSGEKPEMKKREEEEGGKERALKRKRSSEEEEEEEGGNVEENEENDTQQTNKYSNSESSTLPEKSVLCFDGIGYRCMICGWWHKLKALSINHVVKKHDIPKAIAYQSVRHYQNTSNSNHDNNKEDDRQATQQTNNTTANTNTSVSSSDLLREEIEATAKVVRYIANRFVCQICGWKTKLKGFAISHVVRIHEVEKPYSCKDCEKAFFLPSHLQQHISSQHRPGLYGCPFCCFRSDSLGGFRRHCNRCNTREEGDEEEEEEGSDGEEGLQ